MKAILENEEYQEIENEERVVKNPLLIFLDVSRHLAFNQSKRLFLTTRLVTLYYR